VIHLLSVQEGRDEAAEPHPGPKRPLGDGGGERSSPPQATLQVKPAANDPRRTDKIGNTARNAPRNSENAGNTGRNLGATDAT